MFVIVTDRFSLRVFKVGFDKYFKSIYFRYILNYKKIVI